MAHGVPPSGKSPVSDTPLEVREAKTLVQKASGKISFIDKFKAWLGNIREKGDWSFDGATRAATVDKVADEMRKPENSTLVGDATNAESLLTELDSNEFGIFLEAMQVVGGEELEQVETALKGAIKATVEQLKGKDASPLSQENAKKFCENAELAQTILSKGKDGGIEEETLAIIGAAKLVNDALKGGETTAGDTLQLCAKHPDLVKNILGANERYTQELIGQLLAAETQALDETSQSTPPAAAAAEPPPPDASAPVATADTSPAATPPMDIPAVATATPAETPLAPPVDLATVAKRIVKFGTRNEIRMLAEMADSDSEGFQVGMENWIQSLIKGAQAQDAEIRRALANLHTHNKDSFEIYCTLAEAYPEIFLEAGVIDRHCRDGRDEILQKLKTLIDNIEDPNVEEALVRGYGNLVKNYAHNGYEDGLLEFAENFKNFLTPAMLNSVAGTKFSQKTNAARIQNNLSYLIKLVNQCNDPDAKKALVEMFSRNPDKCGDLGRLVDNSKDISMELISLCENSDLSMAVKLNSLRNVKLGAVENLLHACAYSESGNGKQLFEFAEMLKNIEISEELARVFTENPQVLQNLFDLTKEVPSLKSEMGVELVQKCVKDSEACQKLVGFLQKYSVSSSFKALRLMNPELIGKCIENPAILAAAENLAIMLKTNKLIVPNYDRDNVVALLKACADHPDGAMNMQGFDIKDPPAALDILISLIKLSSGSEGAQYLAAVQSLQSLDVPLYEIVRDKDLLRACIAHPQAFDRIRSLKGMLPRGKSLKVTAQLVNLLQSDKYFDVAAGLFKTGNQDADLIMALGDYPQMYQALCSLKKKYPGLIEVTPALVNLCGGKGEQCLAMAQKLLSQNIPIGKGDVAVELLRACADHPNALDRIKELIGDYGKINVTPQLVELLDKNKYYDTTCTLLIGTQGAVPADKITAELVKLCTDNDKYLDAADNLMGIGESVDADLVEAWADHRDGCQKLLDLRKANPQLSIEITPELAKLCNDDDYLSIATEFISKKNTRGGAEYSGAIISADLVKCARKNSEYFNKAKELASYATLIGRKFRIDEEMVKFYIEDTRFSGQIKMLRRDTNADATVPVTAKSVKDSIAWISAAATE
jgi:hypothetical protein